MNKTSFLFHEIISSISILKIVRLYLSICVRHNTELALDIYNVLGTVLSAILLSSHLLLTVTSRSRNEYSHFIGGKWKHGEVFPCHTSVMELALEPSHPNTTAALHHDIILFPT